MVNDKTLPSDNTKITDENPQYNVNREAAKIILLASDKIDKYKYFTGEEMLPSDQSRMIEKAKFSYFRLGQSF